MPRFPGAVTTFDMKSLSESFGLNRINLHLGEFSVREILGSGAVRLQIKLHVIPTRYIQAIRWKKPITAGDSKWWDPF